MESPELMEVLASPTAVTTLKYVYQINALYTWTLHNVMSVISQSRKEKLVGVRKNSILSTTPQASALEGSCPLRTSAFCLWPWSTRRRVPETEWRAGSLRERWGQGSGLGRNESTRFFSFWKRWSPCVFLYFSWDLSQTKYHLHLD